MSYISISFALLVAAALISYYAVPTKVRWVILLITSLAFYAIAGKWALIPAIATASIAYGLGRLIEKKKSKAQLIISNILILLPWIAVKFSGAAVFRNLFTKEIGILGISFYTLELVSYLTDIYSGQTKAEKKYLHFITYALFFPKIMQGPICRYDEMSKKLFDRHYFDSDAFIKGFLEIIWGFFLKFMIADKCSLIVNPVFENFIVYDGLNLWLSLALFLVVLYTDFLACVMICKGVALMFGIELFMNFKRPLLATNFKEFWQRWHISLSNWLSKYIYIPLGGSRKGEGRRLVNLLVTFAVSAFWHGISTGFLMWGFLQALYRMGEEILSKFIGKKKETDKKNWLRVWGGRFKIYFLYGFSLIFFKLPTAKEGFSFIKSMFNFTGLINVKEIGLIRNAMGYKEFVILLLAILVLFVKEVLNEAGVNFKEKIIKLPFAVRLVIYIVLVMIIVSFGTYGYGYNSADFIYGGF